MENSHFLIKQFTVPPTTPLKKYREFCEKMKPSKKHGRSKNFTLVLVYLALTLSCKTSHNGRQT